MQLSKMTGLALLFMTVWLFALAPGAGGQPAAQRNPYQDLSLEPVFYALPENIEITQLENGLEVILMRNPAQPMVGIYTQVKVGSAWEDYRTSGMSHMLEHLLFNGSRKYTQDELYELADRAGAYNNAHTTDFYTNYLMVLPALQLETGLDLQSQMLFHSLVPEEKFVKEQGIVLGELVQARDWAGYETDKALRRAVYGGSSLGLPTLGTRTTIEQMQRDDVYDFYKRWYVPNNMVLTVAGSFDRDRTLALLEQYYGRVAPGTLPDVNLQPLPTIERTSSITRRAGDRRVLALSFEAPTYGMAEFFPYLVLTRMLDLDGTGILTRVLDDLPLEERPQLSVGWQAVPGFGRLSLEFELTAATEPGHIYNLVQDGLAAAQELGVAEEDILGIVRMSETETLLEREQLRMTGIYIAEPVAVGGADFFVSYLDRLRDVTAADVSRSMLNWLVDAPCQAVLIEPLRADDGADDLAALGLPEGMDVPPAMLEALKRQQVAQRGADDPDGGDTPPPSIAPVATAPLKVDRTELENGAVLVSQTNADSPLVAIHLAVRGRAVIDRDNAQAGAVDLVHRLLSEGYAGCDRICLAQQLRNLGAKVKVVDDPRIPMDDYYTNGRFSFIRIETAAENGLAMLEVLAKELQHASFDDADFERIQRERLTDLERAETSVRSVANQLLDETLHGDHPLVLPPEGNVESLGNMDFGQVRRVYRKAFSPENLVFAVVGPIPHAELREHLEGLLGGRGRPAPGLPPLPLTGAPERVTASVGGEMGAIRLGSVLAIDAADRDALRLLVAILSDRLAMDLREERGLSYSVGANLAVREDHGEFVAWLNPPRERLAEGEAALVEAITAFDAGSISQDELDRTRSARTGRMMMRRVSSMGQAYYLAMAELDNDIAAYLGALTIYDNVTREDLLRVAARYLPELVKVTVVVD